MRAVVLTGHGGLDKLEYRTDWPAPRPGAGEVLIRVGACGLNNTDVNTRTAWYSGTVTEGVTESSGAGGFASADAATASWRGDALRFPCIQGADAAGTIAAAGEGVDPARVGERVLVDPWLPAPGGGPDNGVFPYFGSERDGGYADYATVPGENAIPVDSPLSDAELATFPCAYGTAENLVARTGLRPGETVVILGASGGVGSAAVQLCRLRGARVLAVSVPAKAELLKSLGADEVIDRGGDLEADVRHAAGGPVDVALDVAGGALFMRVLRALRQGGRYSSCGAIAGPLVEFDLRLLIYKDLQLTGATIVPPGTMRRIVRLIERSQLRPLLARTYPLAELAQAQREFMKKSHVGNIVVTMD